MCLCRVTSSMTYIIFSVSIISNIWQICWWCNFFSALMSKCEMWVNDKYLINQSIVFHLWYKHAATTGIDNRNTDESNWKLLVRPLATLYLNCFIPGTSVSLMLRWTLITCEMTTAIIYRHWCIFFSREPSSSCS